MKKLIFLWSFLACSFITFGQSTDCKKIPDGRYVEQGESPDSSFYVFDQVWMTEYINNGSQYIKSMIHWEDDCTYSLMFVETNIPDFELEAGTMIRVQITKAEGNKFYYQYLPKGLLEPGVIVRTNK